MFPLSHPRLSAKAVAFALVLWSPLACNTTDGPGAARSAAKAAQVGLTLGGLPGYASDDGAEPIGDLESGRAKTLVDADAEAPSSGPTATSDWTRLEDLVGNWRCSIWGLDAKGNRIAADATWTGERINAGTVQLRMNSFDARGYDDTFDSKFNGYTQLSYAPDTGYKLLTVFAPLHQSQRWVGQRKSGDERYRYYPSGSRGGGGPGRSRSGRQIELRFVGQDVFLLNTYRSGGKGEEQIQSYRFTRTP